MAEDVGQGTPSTEKEKKPEAQSPNTKIHGEVPPGSPMPGAERPANDEIKREINPNTE